MRFHSQEGPSPLLNKPLSTITVLLQVPPLPIIYLFFCFKSPREKTVTVPTPPAPDTPHPSLASLSPAPRGAAQLLSVTLCAYLGWDLGRVVLQDQPLQVQHPEALVLLGFRLRGGVSLDSQTAAASMVPR